MEWGNMVQKGLNPHYLADKELVFLLNFIGIKKRDIDQIYFKVIKPDGEVIYG